MQKKIFSVLYRSLELMNNAMKIVYIRPYNNNSYNVLLSLLINLPLE